MKLLACFIKRLECCAFATFNDKMASLSGDLSLEVDTKPQMAGHSRPTVNIFKKD